jgi:uncharacterized protein
MPPRIRSFLPRPLFAREKKAPAAEPPKVFREFVETLQKGYASLFGEIDQAATWSCRAPSRQTLRGAARAASRCCSSTIRPSRSACGSRCARTARGLYVRGRSSPRSSARTRVLALMRAGRARRLSIGFRTVKARIDPKTRIARRLDPRSRSTRSGRSPSSPSRCWPGARVPAERSGRRDRHQHEIRQRSLCVGNLSGWLRAGDRTVPGPKTVSRQDPRPQRTPKPEQLIEAGQADLAAQG